MPAAVVPARTIGPAPARTQTRIGHTLPADNPLPADIKAVARSLLNDTFTGCMEAVQKLQIDKGVALVDVVRCAFPLRDGPLLSQPL